MSKFEDFKVGDIVRGTVKGWGKVGTVVGLNRDHRWVIVDFGDEYVGIQGYKYHDARKVLALAQEYQDGALIDIRVYSRGYTQYKSGTKNPWGDAVAYAKAYWATHESFR